MSLNLPLTIGETFKPLNLYTLLSPSPSTSNRLDNLSPSSSNPCSIVRSPEELETLIITLTSCSIVFSLACSSIKVRSAPVKFSTDLTVIFLYIQKPSPATAPKVNIIPKSQPNRNFPTPLFAFAIIILLNFL